VKVVPEYRAYIVGADGHFIKFVGLICPNDEVAINHAKQFVDGHDVELWSGDRPVAKLSRNEPKPPETSS
jgi:hypothetical protein